MSTLEEGILCAQSPELLFAETGTAETEEITQPDNTNNNTNNNTNSDNTNNNTNNTNNTIHSIIGNWLHNDPCQSMGLRSIAVR